MTELQALVRACRPPLHWEYAASLVIACAVCALASADTLGALVLPLVCEQPVFATVAVGLVVYR